MYYFLSILYWRAKYFMCFCSRLRTFIVLLVRWVRMKRAFWKPPLLRPLSLIHYTLKIYKLQKHYATINRSQYNMFVCLLACTYMYVVDIVYSTQRERIYKQSSHNKSGGQYLCTYLHNIKCIPSFHLSASHSNAVKP